MKKSALLAAVALTGAAVFVSQIVAPNVAMRPGQFGIAWDYPPTNGITFNVYESTNLPEFHFYTNVLTTNCPLEIGLGEHLFMVRAVDTLGNESDPATVAQ